MTKTLCCLTLLFATFYSAHASTITYSAGTDVVKTNTPVETMYGYDASWTITMNDSLVANQPYTVELTGKTIDGSANIIINTPNGLNTFIREDAFGGSSYFPGSGGGTANFTAPASGSVNVTFDPLVDADCNAWANHCRIPRLTTSRNVPVNSASVNLNITGLQNMIHSFFSLFTVDIASADAQ